MKLFVVTKMWKDFYLHFFCYNNNNYIIMNNYFDKFNIIIFFKIFLKFLNKKEKKKNTYE